MRLYQSGLSIPMNLRHIRESSLLGAGVLLLCGLRREVLVQIPIHAQWLATADKWHLLIECASTLIHKGSTATVEDAVLANGGDIIKITFSCTSFLWVMVSGSTDMRL